MTTVTPDPLIDDYLRRLDAAAAVLPAERRGELVGEIREHIDEALREARADDELAVRNVLERLGPPDEIAAAAAPATLVAPSARRRAGALEIAAVIVLGLGFLLPLVGWVVGAVLLMVSEAWSRREKVVGLVLGLLPVVLLLLSLVAVSAGTSVSEPMPVGVEPAPTEDGGPAFGALELAILVWGFAGLPSAAYLAWRLRRPKPLT